ncbi:MAG: GAF domain-containing protein [Balneolaceae bacterium]|nr:MAG: GAF domain-containing protein [Balneolaceae bacterium]
MKSTQKGNNSSAELEKKLAQREAELAVINSVQKGLASKMAMQEIYNLVGGKIRELFDAQVVMIATFLHEEKKEQFHFFYEDGELHYPSPRVYNKTRQQLIDTKELICINENAEKAASVVPGTKPPKSMAFFPLITGKDVTGYISLQNLDRENAFSTSDVQLLGTITSSISIALENARLFNETEQRNAELAVINSVQEGLVAEMGLQEIYELVGNKIRDLFDAQVAGIATFDHENKTENFQYLFENGERFFPEPRRFDKLRQRLINTRKMIWINENAAEAFRTITGEAPKPIPGTRFPKSVVYVPLVISDSVRGYVTLQNLDREHAFSESDVRLLSTLANSMSVALENARLFSETEQRNAELAVINSVQEGLVREMNMDAIYSLVGNRICEVLKTQTMLIRTFDHDSELETWEYAVENGERLYMDPRPFIWANRYLIKTKEPLLINENYLETAQKYGGKGVSKGQPPKSAIFVPMIVSDHVMGSISLQNVEREHAFTDSDVRLLTTLTNSMSVALENARLFNETTRLLAETEHRATEMQTVNHISRAMVSQLEFDALIKLVGEQMKETFQADIVYIALFDRKTDTISFPFEYGDKNEPRKFGNGFTERIITSNKPLLINKDIEEIRAQLKAKPIGRVTSSFLGVPIQTGNIPNGVISVQSTEEENRFDENDLRLLSTIAANVSVAMQNAEAYRKLSSALDELKSTQEQLVQQEKLASLGQLTAGIAHEIKNPLNFVNNFSEVSLEMVDEAREEVLSQKSKVKSEQSPLEGSAEAERRRGVLSPFEGGSERSEQGDDAISAKDEASSLILEILDDIEANLRKIHEHGSRANGIVQSMLMHSRGGSGEIEPIDLNAIVKEYTNLSFHGMRANKEPINVDIVLQLDETIGKVPLIPEDFSRVILNLCNNAFDAMRDKQGSVHKTQGSGDYKPKLTVRTQTRNGTVIIEVEDNGPGIPDDFKDKILQPFFTTKKGTQGTGLGLSITHDIVKAHGGELNVDSEPGRTTFIIKIKK